ncbi:MAG: lantibiotic dehydratase family protein [Tannerellaceae bacterium]|nr:lantibiotic dehydratase family protein [Tannerellaceae bacterium]
MIQPFQSFILRTPLLPYSRLSDILRNRKSLLEVCKDSHIQEAIYIASPPLYKELLKFLAGEVKNKKEEERLVCSIVRYLSRMTTRSTPFGLFAGCAAGTMGKQTRLELKNSSRHTTRLDMHYLSALCDSLLKREDIKDKLTYYPNSTLYPWNKQYRYIEYDTRQTNRNYSITAVDSDMYLKRILKRAEHGATVRELATVLTSPDIQYEEAVDYVYQLIENQILQNLLSLRVTGDDFFSCLVTLLKGIKADEHLLAILLSIQQKIDRLDHQPHTIGLYEEIIGEIKKLNVPYEEKYLFQVDSIRENSCLELGEEILTELRSAITFLNKITPLTANPSLEKFREAFTDRYGDREIPLMEALDTESGLGYPPGGNQGDVSPLIDDFVLPAGSDTSHTGTDPLYALLLKKLIACLSNNEKEIVLTDEDIDQSPPDWTNLPPTSPCMFEILPKGDAYQLHIKSFGGSSGANLIARFAHTHPAIDAFVKAITTKEQKLMPGVLPAEIVHLPEARVGNILYRPHIREYELLYIGSSSLPEEKRIPVSDLMVSIRGGRIKLRSVRLNKEIIPRLTNAHNYRNNPMPVYHFLCDLQTQKKRTGLYFHWGKLGSGYSVFPRVRYKNTILSPAKWRVQVKELAPFLDMQEDTVLPERISRWREEKKIPGYTLLEDSDNHLFIDWKSPLSLKAFFSIIRKREQVVLMELLTDVSGESGEPFFNECIAVFYNEH